MKKSRTNIAILEPSDIVYEGLSNLILKLKNNYFLYRIHDLDELIYNERNIKYHIAIINPIHIINKDLDFLKFKTKNSDILFLALLYSFFHNETISKFDNFLKITDNKNTIASKISNNSNNISNTNVIETEPDELTQREIEVLICLTEGKSNKEIGETLNISIHTVISHRKNIIEKTGVKSLSGLTIYAISKNIIKLNEK